ncbi:acid-sensing ion channel 1-like isoform X2 [Littorina saxatilis]|uniref:Uncharacterized protein n=1 Tax=Littorina saxatilis TaxID=31220 RepID=A0AAN9G7N9_9CAEN
MTSEVKDTENEVTDDTKATEGAKGIWVFYRSSATIHGVAQVAGPPLYSFRKWIWLFLVLSMGTGLCVILFIQVQRLASFPTRTSVRAEFDDEVPFPAVTLCNLNQFTKSRLPLDPGLRYLIKLLSEASVIGQETYTSTTTTPQPQTDLNPTSKNADISSSRVPRWSNITGPELHQIVWDTAQDTSDFLYLCSWERQIVPCREMFEATLTDLGVCFTFNGRGVGGRYKKLMSSQFGAWTGMRVLMFINQTEYYYAKTMQTGVKVLLHEPEVTPMPSTSGMLMRPGVSAHLAFRRTEHQGLAAPYKAYRNVYCVDTESSEYKHTLGRYGVYTETACYRDCLLEYVVARCNCTSPFEPEETRAVCSVDQMIECYIPVFNSFSNQDLYKCDCRPPCKRVMYNIKSSYADFASQFMEEMSRKERNRSDEDFLRRNVVDVRVFLDSMLVVRVQQEPEMTFTDILGTLGGHLGLFLGASILSITELTEMLLLLLLRCFRSRGKTAKNGKGEQNGAAVSSTITPRGNAT